MRFKTSDGHIVSSIPTGSYFIFAETVTTSQCQFFRKISVMSDLCYLGKTQQSVIHQMNVTLAFPVITTVTFWISVMYSGHTVSCVVPFIESENGCYLLVMEEKSWKKAEAYCQELGDHVHLVRPDTQQVTCIWPEEIVHHVEPLFIIVRIRRMGKVLFSQFCVYPHRGVWYPSPRFFLRSLVPGPF